MFLSLLFLLLALFLLYRYLRENYKLFIKDGLQGPTPSYLIGNLGEFAGKDPLQKFAELTKRFGTVFGYYEGLTPSIVVSDPELIQQILVKNFAKFNGRPRFMPFLHGEEQGFLQNLHGTTWKHMREAMAPAFRNSNIQVMFPKLLCVADQFVDELQRLASKDPKGFDMQSVIESYALDSFCFSALDLNTNSITVPESCHLLSYMRASQDSASPEHPATGLARVYRQLEMLKILDIKHKRLAEEHFDQLSQHMESQRQKLTTSARAKNILQHLLTYKVVSKDHANNNVLSPLTDAQIMGLTTGMLTGGVGPSSCALAFTLHCLAVHPRHQHQLWEEVRSTCGRKGHISVDQVRQMNYLDQVINESIRLYPVAPGVARVCSEDCVVNGVQFRAGTDIRLMGSTQYMDPEIYPDPLSFKPERFSKDLPRRTGSWFPFGSGPRMCVGMRLAQLQIKVAVVRVLQNFQILTSDLTQDPLPVALRPHLTPKSGVHLRLSPRAC